MNIVQFTKKIILYYFFNYLTKAVRLADSYECCRKQHYLIEEKRPYYGFGNMVSDQIF